MIETRHSLSKKNSFFFFVQKEEHIRKPQNKLLTQKLAQEHIKEAFVKLLHTKVS